MADEPVTPGWHLSDNGLKAVFEVGRWVLAAIALGTLVVTSHNQHAERIAQQDRHQAERMQRAEEYQAQEAQQLKAIEDKLPGRRVFLEGP
jgi:uncharacterized protein HemX